MLQRIIREEKRRSDVEDVAKSLVNILSLR